MNTQQTLPRTAASKLAFAGVLVCLATTSPLQAQQERDKTASGPTTSRILAHFDADKNGKLDPAERKELQRQLREFRKEQMALVDADKNGRISVAEQKAAKADKYTEKLSAQSRELLKKLDVNGDGELDSVEKGLRAQKATKKPESAAKP
jgi:hypothetical protein